MRYTIEGPPDLTEYTRDINGDESGRVWGGGGVRVTLPLTRIYPDVHSDLWNLNGLNHTIAVNKFLGYDHRVAMTTREGHTPTKDANEQVYSFFEWALRDVK